jgi:hypothetical protein
LLHTNWLDNRRHQQIHASRKKRERFSHYKLSSWPTSWSWTHGHDSGPCELCSASFKRSNSDLCLVRSMLPTRLNQIQSRAEWLVLATNWSAPFSINYIFFYYWQYVVLKISRQQLLVVVGMQMQRGFGTGAPAFGTGH